MHEISGVDNTLYQQAVEKVRNTPELQPYEEVIFADWPEGNQHLEWVLEATTQDIIDWAEATQR